MDPNAKLTAWTVLAATGALLAFLIGLYTLVGRERKSPYLINSVFGVFLFCMLGAVVAVLSVMFPIWNERLLQISLIFLLIGFCYTFWRIWTIWIRFGQFVDGGVFRRFKHIAIVRRLRRGLKSFRRQKAYELNAAPLDSELRTRVEEIVHDAAAQASSAPMTCLSACEIRSENEPRSLAVALRHQGQANNILGQMAVTFLQASKRVQYMTASRHPIEFIEYLKSTWPKGGTAWEEAAQRIIAVDAYTPHFGFTDSINAAKTNDLERVIGVTCIPSPQTYAGMHTASSKAFKLIKKRTTGATVRQPILMIYEDSYALTDLESPEQYHVFLRHVLPSERLWGGMFTVFAETAQTDGDWRLLSAYASMTLDLRNSYQEEVGEA